MVEVFAEWVVASKLVESSKTGRSGVTKLQPSVVGSYYRRRADDNASGKPIQSS